MLTPLNDPERADDRQDREWIYVGILAIVAWIAHGLMLAPPAVIGEPYFVAESLVRGTGFASVYPFASAAHLHNYIPPLYAYLLADLLDFGASIRTIQWIELGFLAAAFLPIYSLFRSALGRNASLLGLALIACYIPLWQLAACIDPNALNVLFLFTTLERAYNYEGERSDDLTIAGLIALQLILRPDVILFIPLLVFWLVRYRNARWLRLISFCIATAAIVTLPFALRNHALFGSYLPLSSNGGYNLFIGNSPDATGEYDQLAADPSRFADLHHYAERLPQPEFDNMLRQRALTWMRDHPGSVLDLAAKKFWYHWWHDPSLGDRTGRTAVLLFEIASVVLLLLSAIALFRMNDKALRDLLLLLFLYSSLVAMIFFSQTRYRLLKIDPVLIMLSASMLLQLPILLRRAMPLAWRIRQPE